jgi:hypothetical protein
MGRRGVALKMKDEEIVGMGAAANRDDGLLACRSRKHFRKQNGG